MGSYVVVHVRGADEEGAGVIRPQIVVETRAVDRVVSTVVEEVVRAAEADLAAPVPHPVGPLCVCVVAGVGGQSSGHVEEAAVRDCVLVIVTVVEGEDLPFQPAGAGRSVPSQGLGVEDSLCESEPLW